MALDLPSLRSVFQPSKRARTNIENIFDDFFNEFDRKYPYSLLSRRDNEFFPQIDVSETNSYYCVELELPGIDKNEIEIKIDNNILIIKGKKELNKEHKDSNFHVKERFYGDFQRSLSLPSGIKSDAVEASFKDGVLTIKVPKSEIAHIKTVNIKD